MSASRPPTDRRRAAIAILGASAAAVFAQEGIFRGTDFPIGTVPFLLNVAGLAAAMAVLLGITGRISFAAGLGLLLYGFLCVADQLKVRYLFVPVHPADFYSISDAFLVQLFPRPVVVAASLALGAAGLALLLSLLRPAAALRRTERGLLVVLGIGTLLGMASIVEIASARPTFVRLGISFSDASPLEAAERNGILLDVMMRLPDLRVEAPAGYDAAAMRAVLRDWPSPPPPPARSVSMRPPSLIVYVVEALMDPADLGIRFTEDPIPFLRSLRERSSAGWVFSPEFGGRSANVEFELLTGLSARFLPEQSVAYNQFITRPLPGLPRFLASKGYRTSAIHADTLQFFNYPKVYGHLGFSHVESLRHVPGVRMNPPGWAPADEALVDRIIEDARGSKPFFTFAFANSTHLPYDYPDYLDSPLDVVDVLPEPTRQKIKTYVNAVREADRAIEKLVRHFEASGEPIVIAILGDHLPGLDRDGFAHAAFARASSRVEGMALSHRCPAVIWSNAGHDKRDFEIGMSFLAQRLLADLGVEIDGYWRLNAALAARYPVLSAIVQTPEGVRSLAEDASPDARAAIESYRWLHYDVLFGDQLALAPAAAGS